ncbi:MAG: FecR domain-containing protein [Spirochaetota bacterium]|nr:FecR domain-containing protein [Spirochaetota bacterium]
MKYLKGNFLIFSIGAVVITSFSFAYYFDISRKLRIDEKEVVGTISFKRKTAQRKYSSQVVWEDVEQNELVYNNDSIRTADMSEAVIHLKDGTEIALNESSMILLSMKADNVDIEFSHGSVLAKRGDIKGASFNNLSITSGSATVSIGKGDVKLSRKGGKDLNFLVTKGSAKVSTVSGEKLINDDQRGVVTDDSKKIKVYKQNLRLKEPNSNSYILTLSDKKMVTFSWEPVKKGYSLFWEASRYNSFKKIFKKRIVKQNSISISLNSGIYFWRLRSVHKRTKRSEISDVRKLTIIKDDPLQLITPKNDAIISYRAALPMVKFKWRKSRLAKGYKFYISKDRSMIDIMPGTELVNSGLVMDSLDKGTYFWRVGKITGFSAESNVLLSKVYKFSITKKKIIDPPELIYPTNNKRISRTQLKKQHVTFTWNKSPEIDKTRLYLAKDREFKSLVYSGVSKVNFFLLKADLPKGKYYWRVIGVLKDNDKTAPSAVNVFSIIETEVVTLILPRKNAIITPEDDEKYPSVRFSWKRNDILGKYRFQIARDKSFSNIYHESLVDAYSFQLPDIKPNRYYWRVFLLDDDESVLTRSKMQAIIVKDRLGIPDIIYPGQGDVVNMKDLNSLSLKWKGIKGANQYRIALYHQKNKKIYSILEKKTRRNLLVINKLNKLDEGRFFWTLQAIDNDSKRKRIIRKSPIVKSHFKITLGKPIEKPRIDTLKIESI